MESSVFVFVPLQEARVLENSKMDGDSAGKARYLFGMIAVRLGVVCWKGYTV